MATSQSPPTTTIGKRARPLTPRRSSTTSSTSSGLSSTSTTSPETKIARSSRSPDTSFSNGGGESADGTNNRIGSNRPIICTLPPTCNRHPITLANSKELERHYATYHAHVCEQDGCGCVFPEAKLLELHQTECHDPLAAVRKERGEKIFGCMVTTCARYFLSPKTRRLHMIEAHKYPKEFFFAVTNKGIGGLLRKWGEGASMIRGEWKPRDQDTKAKKTKGELEKNDDDRMMVENDDDDEETSSEEEGIVEEVDTEELERTPRPGVRPLHPASPPRTGNARPNINTDVDALAEGMSSLTLIPSSIRFGRGGRGGGLGARGRSRGGRGGIVLPQGNTPNTGGHQRSASTSSATDKKQLSVGAADGRGRGGKKVKGHRVSASIGSGMEMDVPARGGGDIVLVPAGTSGAERNRGSGRGRRGSGKGGAH